MTSTVGEKTTLLSRKSVIFLVVVAMIGVGAILGLLVHFDQANSRHGLRGETDTLLRAYASSIAVGDLRSVTEALWVRMGKGFSLSYEDPSQRFHFGGDAGYDECQEFTALLQEIESPRLQVCYSYRTAGVLPNQLSLGLVAILSMFFLFFWGMQTGRLVLRDVFAGLAGERHLGPGSRRWQKSGRFCKGIFYWL